MVTRWYTIICPARWEIQVIRIPGRTSESVFTTSTQAWARHRREWRWANIRGVALISGRFSLTLSSKINRIVEDIVVSIHLGSGTSSVSATATGDRPPMSMGGPTGAGKRQDAAAEGFAGGGNWEFDPHSRVSYPLSFVWAKLMK